MCCFAQPVRSVHQTKIFARRTGEQRQAIIYQMNVKSDVDNAMILPIPTASNPTERSVQFHDLSDYKEIFHDMDRAFPMLPSRILGPVAAPAARDPSAVKKLEVQEVGDFVASVVPNVEDFRRLDPRFSIAPEVWLKIPEYADYSFVVFQLSQKVHRPHPMAFEFDTRWTDKLFFPTVHIHDGEVHTEEEFDHVLYCQNSEFDQVAGEYTRQQDLKTGWVRSKGKGAETVKTGETQGLVAPDLWLHQRTIWGVHANRDMIIAKPQAGRVPARSSLSAFPWKEWSGGLAALIGTAWLIRRRQRIESEKTKPDA